MPETGLDSVSAYGQDIPIGANMGGWRHGRCNDVIAAVGPPSTPFCGINTARRGWWTFAHHDARVTGAAILTPMGRRPGIYAFACISTARRRWPAGACARA